MDQFISHHTIDHTSDFFGHNIRSLTQKLRNNGLPEYYELGQHNSFVKQGRRWIIVALCSIGTEMNHSETDTMYTAMIESEREYNFPTVEMEADTLIQKLKEVYTNSRCLFFISNHLVNNHHIIMIMSKYSHFREIRNNVTKPLAETFGFQNLLTENLNNVLNKRIHIPRSMENIIDILSPGNIKKTNQWLIVKA